MHPICFAAGFVIAYLTIRAIRGMWTMVGLGLLLCVGAPGVQAYQTVLSIHNTAGAGTNISWNIFFNGSFAGNGGLNSGQTYTTTNSSSPTSYRVTATGGFDTGTLSCGAGDYHVYWPVNSPPPVGAKACWNAWTNTASCCVTVAFMATNVSLALGVTRYTPIICPGDVLPAMCVTNILGTNAVSGDGITFSWSLVRSGCKENDYVPQAVDSGNSGSSTISPGGFQLPAPAPGDIGGQNPSPYNTNKTGDENLHNDLGAMTRLVSKEAKQDQGLTKQDQQLALQTTQNDLATLANSLLRDIKTNTAITANNVNAMNLALNGDGSFTNGGWMGNLRTNIMNADTNGGALNGTNLTGALGMLSNMFNAQVAAMSNSMNSNSFVGGYGSRASNLTEQAADYGTAGTPGTGDGPLDVRFGIHNEYVLSMNPFSASARAFMGSAILTTLNNALDGLAWLKSWLILIIYFVMWWFMYGVVADRLEKASVPAGMLTPKEASWQSVLGALTFGILMQGIVITLILGLPTYLMGIIDTQAGAEAHKMPGSGIEASLTGSGWAGASAALTFFRVTAVVIPWATLFTAIGNMLAFVLLADKALNFLFASLRVVKSVYSRVVPWVVAYWVLSYSGEAKAAAVIFQNFTTNTASISNEVSVYVIPPGQTVVDLAAVEWSFGTNTVMLPDSGLVETVWTLHSDLDGFPTMSVAAARTEIAAFIYGYAVGFAGFSMAWGVSALRMGLRVGMGRTE